MGLFMKRFARAVIPLGLCLCVLVLGAENSSAVSRGLKTVTVNDSSGKQVGLYEESHALVIGVSDYRFWPDLPGVMQDVTIVKDTFERQGFNVVLVKNPDRAELVLAIENFINEYGHGENNRLAFYFAGHGHTLKLAYGGEMGYFVPKDAPNPNIDKKGFLTKAMDMQQIEVYAKRIEAKHALFLFDSCFSGSIFSLSRAIPEHISYKTSLPVRQFITAGGANEKVPDESIFRRQFVLALDGDADLDRDGYVTGLELGEFLQKSVINYSKGTQHPQYGAIRHPDLDKGDFVFIMENSPPPETSMAELDLMEKDLDEQKLQLAEERKKLEKQKALIAKKRGIEEEWKKLLEEKEQLKKEQENFHSASPPSDSTETDKRLAAFRQKHSRVYSDTAPKRAKDMVAHKKKTPLIERVLATAEFGMNELHTRRAISKELHIPASRIRQETQTRRPVRVLYVDLHDLFPDTGPARVSYIFPQNKSRLVGMEIAWRGGHDRHGVPTLSKIGEMFSHYLVKEGHLREDQIRKSQLKDGSVVFFRAKVDNGRMAILRLSSYAEKERKLVLSYTDSSVAAHLIKQRIKKFGRTRR